MLLFNPKYLVFSIYPSRIPNKKSGLLLTRTCLLMLSLPSSIEIIDFKILKSSGITVVCGSDILRKEPTSLPN